VHASHRPNRFGEGPTHFSLLDRGKIGDPPFAGVDPPADFGQPAVTHQRRWYRGGTLDQGEPMGHGRVEGCSTRRAGDGEGVGGDVDDGDNSDKMLSVAKV
jgi:hypothetical protein